MTLKGFLFLLALTIVTVMTAGVLAEQHAAPGFERTMVVAVITAFVVFPAARWAERRGWINGNLKLDDLKNEFGRGKRPGSSDTDKNSPGETR